MSKITNDGFWHGILYSCNHTATLGVKGLNALLAATDRSDCDRDRRDTIQSAGKLTAFRGGNLTSPVAVITGSKQFSQLGAYVSLASYRANDIIIASSTSAGMSTCRLAPAFNAPY